MFGLFSGCWEQVMRKPEYYTLILGLDNAGKTTLLESIKQTFSKSEDKKVRKIAAPKPTVGLNIGRVETDGVKMVFWDLGGQETLRPIWPKYFKEANAMVFVVDGTAEDRFAEARAELEAALHHTEIQGIPVAVCCNKCDIPEVVPSEALAMDAIISNVPTFSMCRISAKNGEGVKELVEWLVTTLERINLS